MAAKVKELFSELGEIGVFRKETLDREESEMFENAGDVGLPDNIDFTLETSEVKSSKRYYRIVTDELSENQILQSLLIKQIKQLKGIKYCLIAFIVLLAANVLLSFIFGTNPLSRG